MAQSLSAVYLHIIFSTKDRRPFLRHPEMLDETHAYLGGIAKKLECQPLRVGGTEDHVHLLVKQSKTISQAEMVKELKRSSTLWFREKWPNLSDFSWQRGYAAFSVSASNLGKVTSYIANQAKHHAKIDYKAELRAILSKHSVAWDEQYLWD